MKIQYREGYKYQLADLYSTVISVLPDKLIVTQFIWLSLLGELTIHSGYAWDGPSGPTIDTKNFMRGSLIHDALYQLIREGHLPESARKVADQELRKACLADGMSSIRAWWVYAAVRSFGADAAAPRQHEVLLAP